MRIVFFGTPDFAVASLAKLYQQHDIAAVVTAPDKPAGRGRQLRESAVKRFAKAHNITCWQPANMKSREFQRQLQQTGARLFVVVAFRMMPKAVWSMPPNGTVNLHASYLPNYRGAAPINHVLINGEQFTGVSTFFLRHQIDTGAIIARRQIEIGEDETAGELHDRLMQEGAELLAGSLKKIEAGKVETVLQETLTETPGQLHGAARINKEDREIDWRQNAQDVHNRVRGLSPYPCAFGWWKENDSKPLMVKLFRSRLSSANEIQDAGTIVETENGKRLLVACSSGWVEILELQWPGKKPMTVGDFLRGHSLKAHARFV